jgi:ferric-dicitrate binding protein FerR (iron transport regulator)
MSDDIMESGEMADVELVTRFLNRQLDPDQDARVRARIENDAAFREFAAPLIIAWSVPPRWERQPRPAGEKERMWDEFTKRAGFVYQKRRRRRRFWLIFTGIVLALVLGVCYFADDLERGAVTAVLFEPVPDSGGVGRWMTLLNGTQVRLDTGTDFRVINRLAGGGIQMVQLVYGRAHLKLDWKPTKAGEPLSGLVLGQKKVTITTDGAQFIVRARNDTTALDVIDRHVKTDSAGELVKVVDAKGKQFVVPAGHGVLLYRGLKLRDLPPLNIAPKESKP